MLTRSDILAHVAVGRAQKASARVFGKETWLRQLSAADYLRLRRLPPPADPHSPTPEEEMLWAATFLTLALSDPDGKRILDDADAERLATLEPAAFESLTDVLEEAQAFNRLDALASGELKKNLERMDSSPSISDSPATLAFSAPGECTPS